MSTWQTGRRLVDRAAWGVGCSAGANSPRAAGASAASCARHRGVHDGAGRRDPADPRAPSAAQQSAARAGGAPELVIMDVPRQSGHAHRRPSAPRTASERVIVPASASWSRRTCPPRSKGQRRRVCPDPNDTTYYLAHLTLFARRRPIGMSGLARQALHPHVAKRAPRDQFLSIPPDQVVELGIQLEL